MAHRRAQLGVSIPDQLRLMKAEVARLEELDGRGVHYEIPELHEPLTLGEREVYLDTMIAKWRGRPEILRVALQFTIDVMDAATAAGCPEDVTVAQWLEELASSRLP